ncbi:MAG: hypothetical protein Q7S33_00385 [Nanoarchaeota archaeon]|nr:hypothetical protein [Nanoarchaeota archaeon]
MKTIDSLMNAIISKTPREKLVNLAGNIAWNDFCMNGHEGAKYAYEMSRMSPNGSPNVPRELSLKEKINDTYYSFVKQYIPKDILKEGAEINHEEMSKPIGHIPAPWTPAYFLKHQKEIINGKEIEFYFMPNEKESMKFYSHNTLHEDTESLLLYLPEFLFGKLAYSLDLLNQKIKNEHLISEFKEDPKYHSKNISKVLFFNDKMLFDSEVDRILNDIYK